MDLLGQRPDRTRGHPAGFFRLEESYGPPSRLDLPGLGLVSAGLFAIVWGLVNGNDLGWTSTQTIATLGVGALLIAAFVAWEARTDAPMIPLRLFRSRAFTAANIVSMLMMFGMFGSIFLLAQFFQVVQGYSPLEAGLRTLPWTFMPVIIAPIAGLISTRTGTRPLLVLGMTLQAAGLAWLSVLVTPTVEYLTLVPAFIIAGAGMGLFFAPIANVVLSAVRPEEEGKASGANTRSGSSVGCSGWPSSLPCSRPTYRTSRRSTSSRGSSRRCSSELRSLGSVRWLPWPCRVGRGPRVPRSTTLEPSRPSAWARRRWRPRSRPESTRRPGSVRRSGPLAVRARSVLGPPATCVPDPDHGERDHEEPDGHRHRGHGHLADRRWPDPGTGMDTSRRPPREPASSRSRSAGTEPRDRVSRREAHGRRIDDQSSTTITGRLVEHEIDPAELEPDIDARQQEDHDEERDGQVHGRGATKQLESARPFGRPAPAPATGTQRRRLGCSGS